MAQRRAASSSSSSSGSAGGSRAASAAARAKAAPRSRLSASRGRRSHTASAGGGRAGSVGGIGGRRRASSGAGSAVGGVGRPAAKKPAFLGGYKRLAKLGTGGFGVVWSAVAPDGVMVAVKQCNKGGADGKASIRSAQREVACAELLFGSTAPDEPDTETGDGAAASGTGAGAGAGADHVHAVLPPTQPVVMQGRQHIAQLITSTTDAKAMWLVFEKCGESLGSLLFDVKGETYGGERIYAVRQRSFLQQLRKSPTMLKRLLRDLIESVAALAALGIVHADIKPDNVLLSYKSGDTDYRECKLIDFGSAFMFAAPSTASPTTPEYLSPELVRVTTGAFSRADVAAVLHDESTPSSTDMWSIGAILLEIMCGFPLWMSYKSRVELNRKNYFLTGLFAATGRRGDKIVAQQLSVVAKLHAVLDSYPGIGLHTRDPEALDLLQNLLAVDPKKRLSPAQALRHPFLAPAAQTRS